MNILLLIETFHKEKMKTIKIQKIPIEKIVSLKCDKCGKEYSNDPIKDMLETQEFLLIDFVGGYGSIFGDGTHVECEVCQYCLYEMIKDISRKTEKLF
jgi:hypothetical protein